MGSIDAEVMARHGFDDESIRNYDRRFDALLRRRRRLAPLAVAVCGSDGTGFDGVYLFDRPRRFGYDEVELGWWLVASSRGQGLGAASLRLALDYGHERLKVRRIFMGTSQDNAAAIGQIRSAGAQEYQRGPFTLTDGTTVDAVWFEHVAS